MNTETDDLVDQLCTRIGIIMEDTSVVALTMGGATGGNRESALNEIEAAARQIVALADAVRVLRG